MPSALSPTRQPIKGLYVLFTLCFETSVAPFWLILYLRRGSRPNPNWTYRQAVGTRIVRSFLHCTSSIEIRVPLPLTPGSLGARFAVLEPAGEELYRGPLADKQIRPARIGATWYPKPPPPDISELGGQDINLHFHGGAFVIGDGRPEDCGFYAKTILSQTHISRVICPQYRLSSAPTSCRFPGALQDAVTSYLYLIRTLNVDPKRIIVSGDSAGGNLALSLLRYISEFGPSLNIPSPGCAWLWSPWCDVVAGAEAGRLEMSPNYSTDYLNGRFAVWGVDSYIGAASHTQLPAVQAREHHTIIDPSDKYLTHKGNPFRTETPVLLQTCDKEVLYFENKEVYEEMSKVEGNRIGLHVQPDAPHDIALVGGLLGFEKEMKACARKAVEFLKEERKL